MRKKLIAILTLVLSMGVAAPGAMAFSKNSLTWEKCTDCHEPKGGKIPRVEEIRTTPDEWAVIIDRMARLYGMELGEGEMDTLLKEICETQILSPEELEKVSYLNLTNNTQTVETPQGEAEGKLFATCVRCHSAGKIYSYRMTESAWAKVRDFHYYVDPPIDGQMREMRWADEADVVLAGLAKTHPYGKAWKAREANPVGSWIILGNEPGKGDYRGHASITAGKDGSYVVEGELNFDDGTSEVFGGEGALYGGHAFRTRTNHNNFATSGAYSFTEGVFKGQHHFPAPDYRTSTSTWYPADGKARVLKVSPSYLLSGEIKTITIEGVRLPDVKAGDIRFKGGNVAVLGAKRVGESIVAQVVYRGTGPGKAELKVKRLGTLPVTLANQIDYITVSPELGRARVSGGVHYPPEGCQFEATAYSFGADTSDPADDLVLGGVPAHFKLSEEITRPGDDDLPWVGAIGRSGTFIPSGDYGRVFTREYKTEATGLVKVEAEYVRGGRHYTAEAKLGVVPPDYVQRIK